MKNKALKFVFTIVAAVMLLLFVSPVVMADTAPETTIDTGLVWGDGINGNFAHSTWYANDRHWVMYVEDVPDIARNIVVSSTDDYGATWDSFTAVSDITTLFRGVAIWYCESTDILHYAYADMGNATDVVVWYRAATPNSNGTFTYLDEAAMPEGVSIDGALGTITIACDKNDLPFVAWTEDEGETGYYWAEVDASTTGNGTWTEDDDAWEEFDGFGAAVYGHDYDALYGVGNWTAVAVNLVPIEGAGSSMMHLSWSIEEMNGTHTAGIDATIYDNLAGWGNLTWVVPPDIDNGLYPDVRGEIAFSAYNSDTSIHFVYCNWIGAILYQEKLGAESWDEINGIGNWTTIMPFGGYNYPAIAGYAPDGAGESLIVVYHDGGSLYYDTKPYGPGGFTGTWTEIWGIPGGPDGDFMFLHSLQYKYGAGSPVGFAWDWGDIDWDSGTTGTLQYWFIDQDGVSEGENPLGWYDGGGAPADWGLAGVLAGFLGLVVLVVILMALFREGNANDLIIIPIVGLIAVAIIFAMIKALD
jgi:hypothetical protein